MKAGISAKRALSSLPRRILNLARVTLPKLRREHPSGCAVRWHSGAAFAWLARCLASGKERDELVAAYGRGLAKWARDAEDFTAAKREAFSAWTDREANPERPGWLAPSGLFAGLYAIAAALPTMSAPEVAAVVEARRLCREHYDATANGRAAAFLRSECRDRRQAVRKAEGAKPVPATGDEWAEAWAFYDAERKRLGAFVRT